jgi:hypothetical protein
VSAASKVKGSAGATDATVASSGATNNKRI